MKFFHSPFQRFLREFGKTISRGHTFFIYKNPDFQYGFTLLELLVVFSIIAVLGALGFASFSSYASHQILLNAASDIKLDIERAKFSSASQVKLCADTSFLTEYNFQTCALSSNCKGTSLVPVPNYELEYVCDGVTSYVYNNESKKLASGVQIDTTNSTCATIRFRAGTHQIILNGSTNNILPSCSIILLGNSGTKMTISVDSSGNVSLQ